MSDADQRSRIMVIDDDPVVIKLTQGVLSANGYDVATSTDAPNGLEMVMKNPPDLIVLDVMMPVINGYNVCRLLKSQESHKNIPIILLTARSQADDRKIGEEVGADAYLSKPLSTQQLLETVQSLLKP